MDKDMDDRQLMDDITAHIAEIDVMFASAKGWGSWMVACANERESLVQQLKRDFDIAVPDKHLARTGSGGRVS